MPMKNSNDTIGNNSLYLPVCSAVPQPLRRRMFHICIYIYIRIYIHIYIYIEILIISIQKSSNSNKEGYSQCDTEEVVCVNLQLYTPCLYKRHHFSLNSLMLPKFRLTL
jgi:hypothetical protein